MIEVGSWVVYNPGYRIELGRVAKISDDGTKAFVCYSQGCTSASTEIRFLEEYDVKKHPNLKIDPLIGYHRFSESCPDFDPEYCYQSCIERFGK